MADPGDDYWRTHAIHLSATPRWRRHDTIRAAVRHGLALMIATAIGAAIPLLLAL